MAIVFISVACLAAYVHCNGDLRCFREALSCGTRAGTVLRSLKLNVLFTRRDLRVFSIIKELLMLNKR